MEIIVMVTMAAVALGRRNCTDIFILLLSTCVIVTSAKKIPIGIVFDESAVDARHAFRLEVDWYNNNTMNFKLDKIEEIVDTTDSYQLTKAVCYILSRGVFALVTVTNRSLPLSVLNAHLLTFNMPLVTTDPTPTSPEDLDVTRFTLRVWPHVDNAVGDIIIYYRWQQFFFLYDFDDALSQFERIMRRLAVREANVTSQAVPLSAVDNSYDLLRLADSNSEPDKIFVLALSSQKALHQLLVQIQRLGMIRHSYHYIITMLAMEQIDLSTYKYGGVNITGFSFLRSNTDMSPPIYRKETHSVNHVTRLASLDITLAAEAVTVVTRGLEELFKQEPDVYRNTFRRGQLYNNGTPGTPCRPGPPKQWRYGSAIIKYFKHVTANSQSNSLAFDDFGFRKNYSLAVLEQRLNTELIQTGTWNSDRGLSMKQVRAKIEPKPVEKNNTLIVTTIISLPFLEWAKQTEGGKPLEGNARFEGYCADLAKELAKICKFDYILKLVGDEKYGESDENGTWNGMVGELTRGEAHLAIAPLTITAHRERVIDFSKPFMGLGISIMIKKPEKQKPGIFSFMEPLSYKIWLCIIVALMGVSVILFFVSRLSPYEWQIEETHTRLTYTNDFNVSNSMWFAMAALMRQGSDMSPRSMSGRIVGSVWWFFTLIIISSYTANLAAFLTIERMQTPIESADDLIKQTEIQYGTLDAGSTKNFFSKSEHKVYSEMWKVMSSATPSVFANTTQHGVHRVRNSKHKYAFLLESTMNDYYNQRKPCNTMKIGRDLDSKGYGIGTPLGSPLRDEINLAILKLTEEGELQKLQKKWWIDKGECSPEDTKGSTQSALTLSNVAGVFYILISCLGLSMLVALVEYAYTTRMERRRHKKNFGEMLNPKNYSSYSLPSSGYTYNSNSMNQLQPQVRNTHTDV